MSLFCHKYTTKVIWLQNMYIINTNVFNQSFADRLNIIMKILFPMIKNDMIRFIYSRHKIPIS